MEWSVKEKTLQANLQGMVSRGVRSVRITETGRLLFEMTDGAVLDLGVVAQGSAAAHISHLWKGTVLSVTSDAGTSEADLKGADGTPRLLVTVTGDDSAGYTADKTYGEIAAAVAAGDEVAVKLAVGAAAIYGRLMLTLSGRLVFSAFTGVGDRYAVMTCSIDGEDRVQVSYPSNRAPVPASIHAVKDDSAVTVTSTYADDSTAVTVIALDENGDPVSVTKDGVTTSLSWEGFDEA